MQTVKEEYFFQTEVKNSKFLAFIMPEPHYKKRLELLKEEHPKARHHVVAYRRLNEYAQIDEYGSDDGEPKGCAGKPTLNVLRGHDLVNCAVIIVRYFGGIKLGTGGMVRAYSLAAKNVIEASKLEAYEIKTPMLIKTLYTNSSQVDYFLERNSVEIVSKIYVENAIEISLLATSQEKVLLEVYEKENMLISII